jgi:hypothetical protein
MITRSRLPVLLLLIALFGVGPALARAQHDSGKPTDGFDLHIDAKYHFPGDGQVIAHHYCKEISGGLTQCQIYDGEGQDARLVGMEVVVNVETSESFTEEEKALWHYHRDEIPLVEATIQDLPEEEAARIAQGLMETYGKVFLLYDPTMQDMPMGEPIVLDIHANVMAGAP